MICKLSAKTQFSFSIAYASVIAPQDVDILFALRKSKTCQQILSNFQIFCCRNLPVLSTSYNMPVKQQNDCHFYLNFFFGCYYPTSLSIIFVKLNKRTIYHNYHYVKLWISEYVIHFLLYWKDIHCTSNVHKNKTEIEIRKSQTKSETSLPNYPAGIYLNTQPCSSASTVNFEHLITGWVCTCNEVNEEINKSGKYT